MPNAEIVAIGSELLLGQIVDTNSSWMAQRLTPLGIGLFYKTVVGDNPGRMAEVIGRALDRSDVVLLGGGLGPTQDDLTREVVAEVTGRKLVKDPELVEQIETRFRRRGFIMTANNERQAFIPEGAIPVENPNGTAPSFIVEDPRGVIFALPGVPVELKWLFDNELVPYLRRRFELSEIITYKILKVADLGESSVDDRIGHLIANSSNPTVGVLAHPGQVDVRIAAKASDEAAAAELIAPVEAEVRELLGTHVFAVNDETIEDAAGTLLEAQGSTIAVYEDVTGGMLTERLKRASPEQFVEGVISNNLTSMRRLLSFAGDGKAEGLPEGDQQGLADALALAVRAQADAGLGIAVHGVPEPGDMAQNLARGVTHISITDGQSFARREYASAGTSLMDRTRMSMTAVALLRRTLMEGIGRGGGAGNHRGRSRAMRGKRAMPDHLEEVLRTLWNYADRHHSDELDGGVRKQRPPVFAQKFASRNVLVPRNGAEADEIRAAIPRCKHHTWFRSMRSSQALTQSVFAAIRAFNRFDLLEDVVAECGQPAFFDDQQDWVMSFEHEVSELNEPHPTNVDVLLSRPGQRVAIECKFLEDEFGTCSHTDKGRYEDPSEYCDGTYRIQGGRHRRCALTEAGIKYWEFLPQLFNWSADRDHEPCPFGATYQLARNALAATVRSDGDVRPTKGHVLVMYDARNPAFHAGGKAHRQWQMVVGASLRQGLFRLLSWQSLLAALVNAPELVYLIKGLGEKYGIQPV